LFYIYSVLPVDDKQRIIIKVKFYIYTVYYPYTINTES